MDKSWKNNNLLSKYRERVTSREGHESEIEYRIQNSASQDEARVRVRDYLEENGLRVEDYESFISSCFKEIFGSGWTSAKNPLTLGDESQIDYLIQNASNSVGAELAVNRYLHNKDIELTDLLKSKIKSKIKQQF